MYKGKDLIGKPVISLDTGKKIEKVHDVLFDVENKNVIGFLLHEKGLFKKAEVLPFNSVKVIGPDAITVDRESAVVIADQDPKVKAIIDSPNAVMGKKVMTEGGEFIGNISDIFIDELVGSVNGYELSGGMFSDAYHGKPFLNTARVLNVGQQVIVVQNETISDIEQHAGGIKGVAKSKNAFQSADKAFERGAQSVKSEFGKLWENVKAKTSSVKEQTSARVEEQSIKSALGKPVTRVVLDEDDNVILKTGDIITHQSIERAREANALDMLLSSVYKSGPTFSSEELKEKGKNY
jgi:uncharacterized protein YrrD